MDRLYWKKLINQVIRYFKNMLKSHINQCIFNNIIMNKKIIFGIIRKFNYLIWLLILIFFTVLVTYFYNQNKNNQINYLNKLLQNTYLNNSLKKITSELKPRYVYFDHKSKLLKQ